MKATQMIPHIFYKFVSKKYETTYMFQFDKIVNDYVYAMSGIIDNAENHFIFYDNDCVCNTHKDFIEMTTEEIDYFNKLKKQFDER